MYELQLMLRSGFSTRNTYQIHKKRLSPCSREMQMMVIRGHWERMSWKLASDRATHLGIIRAGKIESEINISERTSIAR